MSAMQLRLSDRTFVRFLIAGVLNTLFGFAAYSLAILAGLEIWLALLAGVAAGLVFNFVTTGGYVFRDLSPSRFPKFVACYILVYLANFGLIKLLAPWVPHPILAQAIVTFPAALASYWLMSRWVFRT